MSETRTEMRLTLNGVRVRAVWDGGFRVWLNGSIICYWIGGDKKFAPEDEADRRSEIVSEIREAIGNDDLPAITRIIAAQALPSQAPAP